jgi:hypothetical protein
MKRRPPETTEPKGGPDMATDQHTPYAAAACRADPPDEQDRRAHIHRHKALHALAEGEPCESPITHALLALEARLDELTWYIARLT